MGMEDTAEFQLETLADVLTLLHRAQEEGARIVPGNTLARDSKHEAIGYLRALDDVAQAMGLKTRAEYSA